VTLEAQPRRLRIQVVDQGPGSAKKTARGSSEPFYTTREGGTGLGLAISRQIAESAGGSLEVGAAPPGGGACLVLTLHASSRPANRLARTLLRPRPPPPRHRPLPWAWTASIPLKGKLDEALAEHPNLDDEPKMGKILARIWSARGIGSWLASARKRRWRNWPRAEGPACHGPEMPGMSGLDVMRRAANSSPASTWS